MANRKKKTTSRRGLDDKLELLSYEELRRELGFDELTEAACRRVLFEDLDLSFGPPPPTGAGRVTQMGPGRRHSPKGDDDAGPA